MKRALHIFFALCLTGLSSCMVEDALPSGGRIKVGDAVPAFSILGSEGAEMDFTLSDFSDRKTLIVFFVTTCGDCQRELPKVQAAWKALESTGLQLITISREQDLETVKKYWKDAVFTMPWYVDPDRSAYSRFAASKVPRLYLVNKSGAVVWIAVENLVELGINTGDDLIAKINEF